MESLPGVLFANEGDKSGCLRRGTRVHFFPGSPAPVSVDLSPARPRRRRYHFHPVVGAPRVHDHFFRMSRSSSAIRSALRSRTNSSRSAVVSPVRPCVRSARARLTHSRNAVSVRSRSRAVALTVFPSSSTRRTALALNSSVNWRRARRFGVSAIGLDIVFPFGKMSTKPDQVQSAPRRT
jgi:hypothetical protein